MTEKTLKTQINIHQFLTVSVNMLHDYFFKAHKEKSKRLYKEIVAGETVNVGSLSLTPNKDAAIKLLLTLDQSEFKGHLTFHLFQQALGMMLNRLARRIEQKQDLNLFTSEDSDEVLVHVPGLVEDKGQFNVLVLGLKPSQQGALIKLMFLDSDQFRKEKPDQVDEQALADGG